VWVDTDGEHVLVNTARAQAEDQERPPRSARGRERGGPEQRLAPGRGARPGR
jgi:hypothetical protein